jgi:alkylation response protein AidB-like acyl-CoA dehydrogenase
MAPGGPSWFVVDAGVEGFTHGAHEDKHGIRLSNTAALFLNDVYVDADRLIGGVEGQGFLQATGGLELGRINVAARGVGLAEGSLRLATEYAQLRKTFGKPIAQHQAIQLKLGDMVTRARAERLLTFDAAEAYDRGERCDMDAGMAKYFASEAAVRNSEEAMRIFGGYSYSKEYEIERYYRDALLMCIGEGTNEMQRMIIAKQWLKRNPL